MGTYFFNILNRGSPGGIELGGGGGGGHVPPVVTPLQAKDALHLLRYQFHQSPTIGVPLYCMLMDFGGFWDGSQPKCPGS